MLWCEAAGNTPRDFEDLAVFLSQLNSLGTSACVDTGSVPGGLNRNIQFDLAPYLRDCPLQPRDSIAVLGAQNLPDAALTRLRRLAGNSIRRCVAFGAFDNRQSVIAATAKLSYVFGQDPEIYKLESGSTNSKALVRNYPVFGVPRQSDTPSVPRLLLVSPDLSSTHDVSALISLSLTNRFRVSVLTDGKSKQKWADTHGQSIPFYHFGEILPAWVAERFDICISFAIPHRNYRLQTLFANLAISGCALIDGTGGHAITNEDSAFIRGPVHLSTLAPFLLSDILPNLKQITEHVRKSRFSEQISPEPINRILADTSSSGSIRPKKRQGSRVIFMPTNGVGLGHAQRCSLVAGNLNKARLAPVFAVFPSCTRLVKSSGFDVVPLIGRSRFHTQTHQNDLTNYLRLHELSKDAAALVFDGGYVFDSVYRSILENQLRGIWIRRGLWQAEQDNSVALDREKAFDKVIIPREAFEELNSNYSTGAHLHHIGPIVQQIGLKGARRSELRARLQKRFDISFTKLVVTQLGAGVAADRASQIQALCGLMERRNDVLHLVVSWPTAAIQPVWFGWSRSRVVKTHHAGVLSAAADLCISAAGYNSFHEALYNAVPSIFVPQMNHYMDNQEARARAAWERGLAGMAEPENLMSLGREISAFLDNGKAEKIRQAITALDLPGPGNAEAAGIIEETALG